MKIHGGHIAALGGISVIVIVATLVLQSRSSLGPPEDAAIGNEAVAIAPADAAPQTERAQPPVGAVASAAAPEALDSASGQPIIELDGPEYDMGIVSNTGSTTHEVPVYNRGDAPLIISSVRTECGCTQGRMAQPRIEPGQTGTLRITLDPFRIAGWEASKTLTIASNDPQHPAVRLKVHSKVEKEFELEPERIELGEIERGSPAEGVMILRQTTDAPFNLTDVVAYGANAPIETEFRLRPKENWRDPAKKEYEVKVSVSPDARPGRIAARFDLMTDIKRIPKVPRFAIGEVTSVYELNPRYVMLRDVKPGEIRQNVATLVSKAPIQIGEITHGRDEYEVTLREGSEPNTYSLDVKIADDAPTGALRDRVAFSVNTGTKEFKEELPFVLVVDASTSD